VHKEGQDVKEGEESILQFLLTLLTLLVNIPSLATSLRNPPLASPGGEKATARARAARGGRRGTVASRGERVGGERGIAQERLGRAES
jgi:hypothetical protein